MDQAVNHGSGHLLIIEDVYPFAELEVCGYVLMAKLKWA